MKNKLSEYQLLLKQQSKVIKVHQKYLNSLTDPSSRLDKHTVPTDQNNSQLPEHSEILDHLIYKYSLEKLID